ncbi:unnamed protein product, partial [marine sediment metagenome]
RPEFALQLISAILQASAIVTEIGGTLSHAAIISREAGIPCIVGATIVYFSKYSIQYLEGN